MLSLHLPQRAASSNESPAKSDDAAGSKKNKPVDENSDVFQETIRETELKSDLEDVLKKYFAPAVAVALASIAAYSLYRYIATINKKELEKTKGGEADAE